MARTRSIHRKEEEEAKRNKKVQALKKARETLKKRSATARSTRKAKKERKRKAGIVQKEKEEADEAKDEPPPASEERAASNEKKDEEEKGETQGKDGEKEDGANETENNEAPVEDSSIVQIVKRRHGRRKKVVLVEPASISLYDESGDEKEAENGDGETKKREKEQRKRNILLESEKRRKSMGMRPRKDRACIERSVAGCSLPKGVKVVDIRDVVVEVEDLSEVYRGMVKKGRGRPRNVPKVIEKKQKKDEGSMQLLHSQSLITQSERYGLPEGASAVKVFLDGEWKTGFFLPMKLRHCRRGEKVGTVKEALEGLMEVDMDQPMALPPLGREEEGRAPSLIPFNASSPMSALVPPPELPTLPALFPSLPFYYVTPPLYLTNDFLGRVVENDHDYFANRVRTDGMGDVGEMIPPALMRADGEDALVDVVGDDDEGEGEEEQRAASDIEREMRVDEEEGQFVGREVEDEENDDDDLDIVEVVEDEEEEEEDDTRLNLDVPLEETEAGPLVRRHSVDILPGLGMRKNGAGGKWRESSEMSHLSAVPLPRRPVDKNNMHDYLHSYPPYPPIHFLTNAEKQARKKVSNA